MDVVRLRTSAQAFQKKIKNEVWSQASSSGWARPVYSSDRRVNQFLVEKNNCG
jgi:hypothetical protein